MGMLLGCGAGLYEWREKWAKADCPLPRADVLTADGTAVDNAAHLLWHSGRLDPCDRDVEDLTVWNGHALLLSSDTDCLSLWDGEGCIRTARVGVYPQEMAITGDWAYVCGGADGMVHVLRLPELQTAVDFPLVGMPERICLQGDTAYILTLLAEEDVRTVLLRLDLHTGLREEIQTFAGLPGAIAADEQGIWVAASERLMRFPRASDTADVVIEGFGLVRHLEAQGDELLVTDPVEGLAARITQKPRPAVEVLYRGDVGQICFTR